LSELQDAGRDFTAQRRYQIDMDSLTPEITDQTFFDQVEVDGTVFRQVIFDGAELIYRGGPMPGFDRCRFLDVTFTFDDSAGETIAFMRALAGANPDLRLVMRDLVPELTD
jgi:hypothetical protein